jgi:hypothetical protein
MKYEAQYVERVKHLKSLLVIANAHNENYLEFDQSGKIKEARNSAHKFSHSGKTQSELSCQVHKSLSLRFSHFIKLRLETTSFRGRRENFLFVDCALL